MNVENVNLQEGLYDVYVCNPAPRFRVNNGMYWRNGQISGISPNHMIKVLDSTI